MFTSAVVSLAICLTVLETTNAAAVPRVSNSPQQIVDKWIAQQRGGAVAVALVSPSETEFYFASAPNNHDLPNDQTIYEIGSITKGFTGLLLADQVLEGNVFLNDTLSKLLIDWPGRFKSEAGNVTLLELTTHSSGLPTNTELFEDLDVAYTKKQLYAWLDTAKLSKRGSFLYNNAGVALLGEALSLRARKPYENLVKERVLLPLGLRDATITLDNEQRQRFAPGHGYNGKVVNNLPFEVLAPAGAMKFSAAEFVNFLQFTIGLKEHGKRMDEALELSTKVWGNASHIPPDTIGFCWMQRSMPENYLLIWHNGATIGYNAFVGWIPEQQIGVAVLMSLSIYSNSTVEALGLDILRLNYNVNNAS